MGLPIHLLAAVSAVAIPPSTVTATYTDVQAAFTGFYTMNGSQKRFAQNRSVLAFKIKGSAAELYCGGGDTTPYRVLVNSQDFSAATVPTLSGGKIPLFTGLTDTEHTVLVYSDNSDTGQYIPTTGTLVSATGVNPVIAPLGTSYMTTDPAFPGMYTGPRVANATHLPAIPRPMSSAGWGTRNIGSLHCRAKFTDLYLLCTQPNAYISVDGGPMVKYALAPVALVSGSYNQNWRRVVGLAGDLTTYKSLIISASGGINTSSGIVCELVGVLLTGSGAEMAAPTGTKRHCLMFGASQVEGIGADSAAVDVHMVQPSLPIYGASAGWAGKTIVEAVTAFAAWAANVPYKDIILLSIGTNSPDDANFVNDYKALIQASLTAGFQKVVCRGILDTAGFQAGKNPKIAQAVSETADARVVYASVDTWDATTDGAGGTVSMPDNNHPDEAGYRTLSSLWVRDHAALFT